MRAELYQGDCLELMKTLPDGCIDMVLCDPPYGMTNFEWDKPLELNELWAEYRRVIKPHGIAVLFGSNGFAVDLAASGRSQYKYTLTWVKNCITNPQNAKYQPLRRTEQVLVFAMPQHADNREYFPKCRAYMLEERKKCGLNAKELKQLLGSHMTSHYFTHGGQFSIPKEEAYNKLQSTGYFSLPYAELQELYQSEKPDQSALTTRSTYNPQGVKLLDKPVKKTQGDEGGGTAAITNTVELPYKRIPGTQMTCCSLTESRRSNYYTQRKSPLTCLNGLL